MLLVVMLSASHAKLLTGSELTPAAEYFVNMMRRVVPHMDSINP